MTLISQHVEMQVCAALYYHTCCWHIIVTYHANSFFKNISLLRYCDSHHMLNETIHNTSIIVIHIIHIE